MPGQMAGGRRHLDSKSFTMRFAKMHGLGNDFVVLDSVTQVIRLTTDDLRLIADRRLGVGFDQMLVAERATDPEADVRMRIFNTDGTEAEQCGNGLRCFAQFVRANGLVDGREIRVQTAGGLVRVELQGDDYARVDMGTPVLDHDRVPFVPPKSSRRRNTVSGRAHRLEAASQEVEVFPLSMGNPHAVIRVPRADKAAVVKLGRAVQSSSAFPNSVNVGFMEVLTEGHIRLRVYERGVGETLACGSGACAAVVAGRLQGWLAQNVTVSLPGGELDVSWAGDGHPVWLAGPATRVFDAELNGGFRGASAERRP